MRLGYPRRPDPAANPVAYRIWLTAVTQPLTVLQPQTIPGQGVRWGNTTSALSSNWSGYVLAPDRNGPYQLLNPYVLVIGHWIVPDVIGEQSTTSHVSEWVGLDGDSVHFPELTDLVQAGTAQEAFAIASYGSLTSYYAWTEVLPLQPVEQVQAGFPVHLGDGILCTVWVGDDAGTPGPDTPSYAFFQLLNSSLDQPYPYVVTYKTKIVGQSVFDPLINFEGLTAEWIVERPGIVQGGQDLGLSDLANYQSQCYGKTLPNYGALYFNASSAMAETEYLGAGKYLYESFPFSGHDNFAFSMNDGNYLSIATAPDSFSVCFSWLGSH